MVLYTCEVVTNRLGPLTYLIQLPNGILWRWHVDHLREGSYPDPSTPMESNDPPVTEDFSTVPSRVDGDQLAETEVPPCEDPPLPQPSGAPSSNASSDQQSSHYPAWDRRPPDRLYETLQSQGEDSTVRRKEMWCISLCIVYV